jgi:hypothetical protein
MCYPQRCPLSLISVSRVLSKWNLHNVECFLLGSASNVWRAFCEKRNVHAWSIRKTLKHKYFNDLIVIMCGQPWFIASIDCLVCNNWKFMTTTIILKHLHSEIVGCVESLINDIDKCLNGNKEHLRWYFRVDCFP